MAITFDTLKFVETLEQAGVDRKQASAIANAVRDSQDTAEWVTKGDLRELEHRWDAKVELLRRDLIIKLGGMLVVGFGSVIGILLKLMA